VHIAKIFLTCFQRGHEELSWSRRPPLRKIGPVQQMESNMKKIALAAALSLAASTAFAGGVKVETVTPAEVLKPTSSSAGGLVVPLLLLIVVLAIASGSSGGNAR
jgi:FtsH-binding integral membrane protein